MQRDGWIEFGAQLRHHIDDTQLLAGSLQQSLVVIRMWCRGGAEYELGGKKRDDGVDGGQVTAVGGVIGVGTIGKDAIDLPVGHNGDAVAGIQAADEFAGAGGQFEGAVARLRALGGDAGLHHIVVPWDAPGAPAGDVGEPLVRREVRPVRQTYLVERDDRAQQHKYLLDAGMQGLVGAQRFGTRCDDPQMRLGEWCCGWHMVGYSCIYEAKFY